ncbi:YvrJ family protein [uncultured Phascolarctobacterium sp.]|uniref:YvrJ family protein n=1 Tax=uncultured Phascolarctobacterium sp. TaxID=512296 RepID=UPI002602E646|nr:YvrJ family protein [uncultured Phascolarctobacterium sp.]
MEFERLLSAAADYGFPMLVSSYLLVRMEGRIEKLSANIENLTRVLQERLVMQFPYVQQQ